MHTDATRGGDRPSLPSEVQVVNVGLSLFGDAVRAQHAVAVDVDWRVPARGDIDLVAALARLYSRERVEDANVEVLRRLDEGRPEIHGLAPAREVLPGVSDRTILHPGPSLDWADFCDPLRRSVRAAVMAEGWAASADEANGLVSAGVVLLEPANAHATVVPMATALGPSAPVWVAHNPQGGNWAFAPINQGSGRTQWMGVDAPEAVEQLRWLRDVAAPVLDAAVRAAGPVDVLGLAAQGLQMGDDLHMRVQGATSQLIRHLLPHLTGLADDRRSEVAAFVSANHLFFLTLGMAGAKALTDWAASVQGASIVTGMTRNGTTFGARLAGQDRWFVAPAPAVGDALYHADYGPDDGAPDIGDSAVLELIGLGGPAAAASPAVAGFLGGTIRDAVETTRDMGRLCIGRSTRFRLPFLDFEGTPLGVDARLVVELGITPAINTGILDASDGRGQIGAGIARAPLECFRAAVLALDAGE